MLGMIYWPLNRRRTLLSIPLGFLQLGASFLYLSDPLAILIFFKLFENWKYFYV